MQLTDTYGLSSHHQEQYNAADLRNAAFSSSSFSTSPKTALQSVGRMSNVGT